MLSRTSQVIYLPELPWAPYRVGAFPGLVEILRPYAAASQQVSESQLQAYVMHDHQDTCGNLPEHSVARPGQ